MTDTRNIPSNDGPMHGRADVTRWLVMLLFLLLTSAQAMTAQPSDAQVKKDISGVKTLGVTLSSKPGTKQWNSSTSSWEFVRGAVCTLKTDEPGVTLLVKGDAVYNLAGSKATYRKFRVISNEYLGMETVSLDTANAMMRRATEELFGNYNFMQMVAEPEVVAVVPDSVAPWTWHTLNSVEFTVATRYRAITNNTTVSHIEQTFSVRLYRDRIDAPWKPRFVSTPRERTVLGTETFTAEQIRSMPTLGTVKQSGTDRH